MTQIQNNIDKKRMAKNTLLLYARMFLLLLLGFYNVRLLLRFLGIEDYGLYNVIFGLVTAFSFFSGAMQSTVQRYLCYELGRGESGNPSKVFSVSLVLFAFLSIAVLLFAETAGLWFVHNKLNIPNGKMTLVQIIYQFSILMVIFRILQLPYSAAVTSHENMRIFALFSIVDAVLHLISIVALAFIRESRLIYFVGFYTFSSFVILLCYIIYCRKKYDICRVWLHIDRKYLKEMSSFFSWSIFGAVSNMAKSQGVNLLLNIFYGVILNATWGIATQVSGVVSQFYGNFQQAFNPQILKSYNASDRKTFFDLLQSCSKYSFLLIWLVALPILLQTEFLLKLWLGNNLPESSVIFTRLMIITVVFDAICSPLWIAVQATGNIRRYQIEISLLICSTFVFSLIALKMGAPAYFVALINAIVNFSTLLYRLVYLRKNIGFTVLAYIKRALIPMAITALVSCMIGVCLKYCFHTNCFWTIAYLGIISIINAMIIIFCGLSGGDRNSLFVYFKHKIGI